VKSSIKSIKSDLFPKRLSRRMPARPAAERSEEERRARRIAYAAALEVLG